jgi:hypothetical protein
MLQQPLVATAEDSFGNAEKKNEELAENVHGRGGAGTLNPRKKTRF